MMQNADAWAEEQWGQADLGDRRRTARAIKLGAAIARQPEGSLPHRLEVWGEIKAAYRLLECGAVSHEAVLAPHLAQTRALAEAHKGPVLFVQDTTVLDYAGHRATTGLGPTADGGKGHGVLVHTCLAVAPAAPIPRLLGAAAQQVWVRPPDPRKPHESRTQRRQRPRESQIWAHSVERSGPPPAEATWISVGDAESDIFEYLQDAWDAGYQTLARACQNRRVWLDDDRTDYLLSAMRALPATARRRLHRPARGGQAAETMELSVAWQPLRIRPPRAVAKHAGPDAALEVWCVRAWNTAAELEWILISTLPVTTAEQAFERLDWYSARWLIEEFHKAIKSGCGIENSRLRHADRLTALLGFITPVGMRLLQLREQTRRHPDGPARDSVPETMRHIIAHRYKLDPENLTRRQFWHSVARMGGFIGRKSDGDPGWQTLWIGFMRLLDMTDALGALPPK